MFEKSQYISAKVVLSVFTDQPITRSVFDVSVKGTVKLPQFILKENPAIGGFTCIVLLIGGEGQRLLNAINLIVSVPESLNIWIGFWSVDVPPSPNFHNHVYSFPHVVRSLNRIG